MRTYLKIILLNGSTITATEVVFGIVQAIVCTVNPSKSNITINISSISRIHITTGQVEPEL